VFRFGISLAFLKIIFLQWRNFDVAFIPPLTLAPPLGGVFFYASVFFKFGIQSKLKFYRKTLKKKGLFILMTVV
jgi:hypothetical protein